VEFLGRQNECTSIHAFEKDASMGPIFTQRELMVPMLGKAVLARGRGKFLFLNKIEEFCEQGNWCGRKNSDSVGGGNGWKPKEKVEKMQSVCEEKPSKGVGEDRGIPTRQKGRKKGKTEVCFAFQTQKGRRGKNCS